MAHDLPSTSIVGAIDTVTAKFNRCRNRVWAAARSLGAKKRDELLQILATANVEQTGGHKEHD
jgi:hypothetical protein